MTRTLSTARNAFTLIELLVVIAVISILAAILFPVFAQAKLSAQKTTDLSNGKQIGAAMLLYEADADDNFPTYAASYCPSALIQNPLDPNDGPGGSTGGRHPMWQFEILPYLRSWHVYFAPGDTVPNNSSARYHNISYGYNYGYLSKLEISPDPSGCGITGWFSSKATTVVSNPAATIAVADSGGAADFKETPSIFGDLINPPDAMHSTEKFYGLPESGWGADCRNYFAGTPYGVTDGFSSRYFQGGNVLFVDGHANYYKTNGVAAGTNFDPTQNCKETRVTDNSKYLWDPRGTSAPPE